MSYPPAASDPFFIREGETTTADSGSLHYHTSELNPNPDRDIQWRGRGYVRPDAPVSAPTYGTDVTPVTLQPSGYSLLWIIVVIGFITFFLALVALFLAASDHGFWYRLQHRILATKYNVTLQGDLGPLLSPSPYMDGSLFNVSAIQFDNNFKGSGAANARIAVYNPILSGLRDHGNGSLEILTATEGVLKTGIFVNQIQQVGVQTRLPEVELHVNGTVRTDACYQLNTGVTLACPLSDGVAVGDAAVDTLLTQAAQSQSVEIGGVEVMKVSSTGLLVTGSVESTVGFMIVSDSRVKRRLSPMNTAVALQHISELKVMQYEYTPHFAAQIREPEGVRHVGIIAQEAEQVVPGLVKTHKDSKLYDLEDFKMVDQARLIMELLMAVQQLEREVRRLEEKCSS